MTKKESNIMLFSITLCWSSSYIFIKDLPADLSAYAYLALTTGIASIIMLVIFHKSLLKLNPKTLLRGTILAALIAVAMIFEKKGLEYIPSSTASFLFSLNIIIVPIILLLFRKFPSRNNVAGIIVILCGLFISNAGSFGSTSLTGVLYELAACFLMALYTISAAEFTKKSDPLLLSVLQMTFSAIIGFVLWLIEDPATFAHITWSKQMLSSIFILAFFAKAYAYIMLMYAQKYADAIGVTVISATEPVVTLVLAILIPNMQGETESFSVKALVGALVIAAGAIIAGSNFLSPHKNKIEETVTPALCKEEDALPPESPAPVSPAAPVATAAPALNTGKWKQVVKQFLITMVPFVVLGAAFKVMVLVDGLTEVRPANAIPMVSGLLFGPIGALGCAVGNVIADCFGTLNWTSLLGVVGNFFAAYIPYRVWHTVSRERPNVHTWKNLLLYVWAACLGTLTCAWILGFGLELFFGIWIDTVYKYVLLNNLGFSLALGLPIFILATSDSINIAMRLPKAGKHTICIRRNAMIGLLAAETAVLGAVMVGIYLGYHLSNSVVMGILTVLGVLLLVGICILNGKSEESCG